MDHNKLIAAAAKKGLTPLGLRRDGKSRIWYDDHGWWVIVVEFQPSGWSRGSYLNVAVSWLLYEQGHWTFDVGGREEGFKSADNPEQFEAAIDAMASHAAQCVQRHRRSFDSLERMYAHYAGINLRSIWVEYYAAVLAGLSGNSSAAERHFSTALAGPCRFAWEHGLRLRCQDLLRFLPQPEAFRDSVLGIVLRSRAARGLEEMPIDEIALP
ncbi:MAG TPA: hypothetical protein VG734_19160 [Lacunisphaera sp.]|nr:hypothetical protein [Lacunisphaera sp.]